MGKMGLLSRPVDLLVLVLLCYFLFSCWCIETKYCADGLSPTDKRFMMPETYQFAREHNPYFLSAPEWLRTATCFSAYGFSTGYLAIAITYVFGLNFMRIPILMFIGAKIYAIAFYHVMEFTSSLPPENMLPYWGTEAPFLVSICLVIYRMRKAEPFSAPPGNKRRLPAKKAN